MNISKIERRALEMLSFGGKVLVERDHRKRIVAADFVTREGWFLEGYGLSEFAQLRSKKLIISQNAGPYRITKLGVLALSRSRGNAGAR